MVEISESSSPGADDLLSDLAFVMSANPEHVLGLSDRVSDPRARLVSAVYRASASVHRSVSPAQRRQMLAVDAARFDDRDLAARWTVDWASGSL